MGKPTHKALKLYKVMIGRAVQGDGDEPNFDSRKVIAVDAKDALAQLTDLAINEYVAELHILESLDGVQIPAA